MSDENVNLARMLLGDVPESMDPPGAEDLTGRGDLRRPGEPLTDYLSRRYGGDER